MAWRTERHQAVKIEVRTPLGALDDVVDLEGAPAATGLAPSARTAESTGAAMVRQRAKVQNRRLRLDPAFCGGSVPLNTVGSLGMEPSREGEGGT
jgi:hypothetical protein